METWLERRPTRSTPAPEFRTVAIDVSTSDTDEMQIEIPVTDHVSRVAGIHVAIEYEAADGALTRRRITMQRLSAAHGTTVLHAICHERHALRAFRVDRIQCMITLEGEILDPAEFWATIGVDPNADARAATAAHVDTRAIESLLGPQTLLLAGIANCDGYMHPAELDAIIEYIEITCENSGFILGSEEVAAIRNRVRRLRPDRETLSIAVETLFGRRLGARLAFPKPQARRFLRVAARVADADSEMHRAEYDFLAELSELAGE